MKKRTEEWLSSGELRNAEYSITAKKEKSTPAGTSCSLPKCSFLFVSAVAYNISVLYPRVCFLFSRFSSSFSSRLTR